MEFFSILLEIPLKQLDMSKNLNVRLILMDKNRITGDIRIITSIVIPEYEVRKWIANGRYEGTIDLNEKCSVTIHTKCDICDDFRDLRGLKYESKVTAIHCCAL